MFKIVLGSFGILQTPFLPFENASSPAAGQNVQKPAPKINLNRATQEELMTLPGIGPALAQRILDYRAKNPPFKRPEDLLILRGINRKLFDQIKDRIEVK